MMGRIIKCEVYSRVVGYFRPVQNWNDGKRQEFSDRRAFNERSLGREITAGSSAKAAAC